MGSSDADIAQIKTIQPVVTALAGVLTGAGAILGLTVALQSFS